MSINGEISSNIIQKTPLQGINVPTMKLPGNAINLIESLRRQIRTKEEELQQAEKINKNFERMIQLVNILGQVDSFLTDRTKVMIKKLAVLAEDEEEHNKVR